METCELRLMSSWRCKVGLFAFCSLLLTFQGCSSAMTAPTDPVPSTTSPLPGHSPFTGTAKDWPLRFASHNFGAQCFSTQRCRILYANFPHGSDQPQGSWESYGHPHQDMLSAGRLSLPNFPPPAELDWVSKDGSQLHATVDIGEIFKDKLIRHNVPRDEVPEDSSIGPPGIIIEIDDRTVSVYMKAHIPTKHLQKPGNIYSDFRSDLIKVYSKTY